MGPREGLAFVCADPRARAHSHGDRPGRCAEAGQPGALPRGGGVRLLKEARAGPCPPLPRNPGGEWSEVTREERLPCRAQWITEWGHSLNCPATLSSGEGPGCNTAGERLGRVSGGGDGRQSRAGREAPLERGHQQSWAQHQESPDSQGLKEQKGGWPWAEGCGTLVGEEHSLDFRLLTSG